VEPYIAYSDRQKQESKITFLDVARYSFIKKGNAQGGLSAIGFGGFVIARSIEST